MVALGTLGTATAACTPHERDLFTPIQKLSLLLKQSLLNAEQLMGKRIYSLCMHTLCGHYYYINADKKTLLMNAGRNSERGVLETGMHDGCSLIKVAFCRRLA